MMMIRHHRMDDIGDGPDRVIVYIVRHKHHKRHRYQRHKRHLHTNTAKVIQEPFTVPDEDSGSSGRRQRSRSRERAPVHVPIYTDDESAAGEPQSCVSDRSRSPQGKESPQRKRGKKNTAEVKKPRDLPKAKKHKPMDSEEDDEVLRNEPGTSSNTQPPVPALPLRSGSTSSSHGSSTSNTPSSAQRTSTSTSSENESADNDDNHGEGESGPIQSARSQDSGREVLYPDLYVLTNDEHWTDAGSTQVCCSRRVILF